MTTVGRSIATTQQTATLNLDQISHPQIKKLTRQLIEIFNQTDFSFQREGFMSCFRRGKPTPFTEDQIKEIFKTLQTIVELRDYQRQVAILTNKDASFDKDPRFYHEVLRNTYSTEVTESSMACFNKAIGHAVAAKILADTNVENILINTNPNTKLSKWCKRIFSQKCDPNPDMRVDSIKTLIYACLDEV